MLKIGIKHEGKIPPDTRVPLTPRDLVKLKKRFSDIDFKVEKSPSRCFKNDEYARAGFTPVGNISDCDIILGVKETQIARMIPAKTYLYFSHVIKKQAYNKIKLQAILRNKIRLIDYELLKDESGNRLIGFGHYAGIVGAHYALWMWGKKNQLYSMNRAVECYDYQEMTGQYENLHFGNAKILLTGNGRVSKGAAGILRAAQIREVNASQFIGEEFNEAVFVQLDVDQLYVHKKGNDFVFQEFFDHPDDFESIFEKFITKTNILINGMYWDMRAPRLFEKVRIQQKGFGIKVISDISCDINGSVPITTRATSIADPVYGYSAVQMKECLPFTKESIDMMTVDNLPNELPRDASTLFGEQLSGQIIPLFIENPDHPILENASITKNGNLTKHFAYLEDYVYGKE
ncbi:MAG: alanine dehydrogenase [Bacteroidetes bacterium]|nr:alanine dehydrogenase [Bacteroidota bacterium]